MSASRDNNQNSQPPFENSAGDTALLPGRFKGGNLPERYTVKSNGDDRVLTCLEAPNLNVHIEAGLAFSASVARKSPSGTIFVDGVAQCEPFMDHERQVYNLDHHEGCVRSFTLAACEQALVLYMKGLDLQSREWNIFANEPDLDTVLAIWIILNHARIGRQDATQRRLLFALVRYEGIIDAMGLELKELCALPGELMRKIQRVIDHLRSDEVAMKKEGRWEKADYLTYTAAILHKVDQIFYKPSDFADYFGVEELARIDLTDQRIAAVVEADMGIYEIEPHLNKLYGNRLGVVFLKKGLKNYTVRQMDMFMPITLEEIYERLNFVDKAVKCRTLTNKWGGAADIGGSPRDTGTRLTPPEIVQACRDAVRKPDLGQKAYRFGLTAALVGFIVLCAHIVRLIWDPSGWLATPSMNPLWVNPDFGFVLTLSLASGLSLAVVASGRAWQYGWTRPIGGHWWAILPAALAGGVAGGLWAPPAWVADKEWLFMSALGVVGMPLAAEMLFRGLAHGLLAQFARIQRYDTRWFLSWPTIGSTLLYVGFALTLFLWGNGASPPSYGKTALCILGATLLSLTLGMVRERSQSIWPAVLFHMLAAAAAFLMFVLL
jgi:hypothetical protein